MMLAKMTMIKLTHVPFHRGWFRAGGYGCPGRGGKGAICPILTEDICSAVNSAIS